MAPSAWIFTFGSDALTTFPYSKREQSLMKSSYLAFASCCLVIGLAACQREAPSETPPTETPAPSATSKTPAAKIPALTPAQVAVTMEAQGPGATNPASGKFEIPVKITNNGKVELSDQTDPPVRIGVQILAADDGSGGVRDFARSSLPRIEPGQSRTVNVVVPVDKRLDGHRLNIELVQERVAWFSRLGQPGITVGPYALCDKTLCAPSAQ